MFAEISWAQAGVALSEIRLSARSSQTPSEDILANSMDIETCGAQVKQRPLHRSPEGRILDMVFWVEAPHLTNNPASQEAHRVEIRSCQMSPRINFVHVGQSIQFFNLDGFTYDLQFEAIKQGTRSRALPPNLKMASIAYEGTDFVSVRCLIHPSARSFFFVKQHDFYATSDASGWAKVSKLPQGRYPIYAWHEKIGFRKTKEDIQVNQAMESVELNWDEMLPWAQ